MIIHLVDGTYELFRHFTGAGIERALRSQFEPLEQALAAMGVAVWAMVELEADDALASAAYLAARDSRVEKICIWTPSKGVERGRTASCPTAPAQIPACGFPS